MRPFATQPADDCRPLLPLADFADAYALDIAAPILAPEAARRAFGGMPSWARHLLTLRNAVVGPLGLKTRATGDGPSLGMFPILLSTPSRVVLGMDDRHLDFRIVVDVQGNRVTMTTLVQRHGWAGRAYLALVLPFHKRIVPATLARVALA